MGKAVARIRFKGSKGKRWKKGQSSSSNPILSSFREAAKNRFFAPASGQSNLTLGAIAKHNAENNDCEMDDVLLEDKNSLKAPTVKSEHNTVAKTANTWASHYTDCTNATFGRVHRFSTNDSAMHKEILAVLAAVTEIIKQRGGNESETEYFAALMTALESIDNEESISAVMYLLTLVIKRLPPVVVRNKFSEISKAFMTVLDGNYDTDTPALLRSTIICLASVLRMQEFSVWAYSSTEKAYDSILRFIVHAKPRVRKAAHQAVRAILNGSEFMVSPNPPAYHPIASHTAKYCIFLLEKDVSDTSTVLSLHVLTLLKDIMSILPSQALKSTCETILKLLTLADVMLTSVAMKALHGMFSANPDEKSLPADLNARLITALYDYQPNVNDSQPLNAWLSVLEKAVIHLNDTDSSLSSVHLVRIFEISIKCLLTEKPETIKVASKAIRTLLYDCVRLNVDSLDKAVLAKLFSECENALGYQYHSAWQEVLRFLSSFFQILKPCHYQFTIECLQSIAELRSSDGFPYQSDVDQCIGQAIKTFGPRNILEAIPLKITGENDDYDFPRSWILPVLRENICNTELAYFSSYFLPLAAKLRNNAVHFMSKKQHLEAKTYGTLYLQIWSLLPGFCTNPTDLLTVIIDFPVNSFKGIAKTMGTVIGEQADLRQEVMSSLRKLVNFSLNSDDLKNEIGHYAKNFLPIFLNLFTSTDIGEKSKIRLAILETIKCYLQVSDRKIITMFFEKCHQNLQDKDLTSFKRHALLDIILPMIIYLERDNLQKIFDVAMKYIKSKDRTNEKKSYRLLEELFSVPNKEYQDDDDEDEDEKDKVSAIDANIIDHRKLYIESNIENLMTFFTNTLGKSNPSSKAPRLRCFISIFKQIDTQQLEFLSSILPEIVLCTKEEGESARKNSFIALKAMGSVMLKWVDDETDNKQEAITEFFTMLLAGLGGNPHMISCSLLSLTAVTFKFKEHISDNLLETLVSTLTILLNSAAREIVHSALGLIKCLFTVFSDTRISPYLKPIVASVIAMKEDCQKYLRVKIKEMFVKWTRKYGYDLISSMVPESHRKMLKNIKKTQERIQRKKAAGFTDDDDCEPAPVESKPATMEDILRDTDSEVEDDNVSVGTARSGRTAMTNRSTKSMKSTRSSRSSKDQLQSADRERKPMQGAAWLKDGSNIIDFLDPSVASNVMASRPKKNKEQSEEGDDTHGFKLASNGKLIISDAKNDDINPYRPKQHINDDDDDLEEIMATMGVKDKSRKRRYADDYNEGMSDLGSTMEYKAGGGGIHRDLSKKKAKPGGSISRKDAAQNYKAKKASGDVKKIGKHDPYAYVPLEFNTLNKRKRAKQSGKFKGLIKGAQKGSKMGQKLHIRNKMNA